MVVCWWAGGAGVRPVAFALLLPFAVLFPLLAVVLGAGRFFFVWAVFLVFSFGAVSRCEAGNEIGRVLNSADPIVFSRCVLVPESHRERLYDVRLRWCADQEIRERLI